MLGRARRLVILAEGHFHRLEAKTALGVLRYRPDEVVAILDASRNGRTAQDCVGVGGDVPVVGNLEAAARLGADSLMIGIAPQGGGLPDSWRPIVREAISRGWDVLSGLHVFLADDAELASLARASGAVLHDVRRPPRPLTVAAGRAADVGAYVVLTVGTDCNVGKMTASLELARALERDGLRAAFVATGQTGIFIADHGVAVDAVPGDFAAGAIESLVIEAAADADVVIVEGQGALHHPGFSGVTLSLMHGAAPAALVLCHEAARSGLRRSGDLNDEVPIAPLEQVCSDYEQAAAWVRPAPVSAIAMNTSGLDEAAARKSCSEAAVRTGRPAADPVRFGAGPIADALRTGYEHWRAERGGGPPAGEDGRPRATSA